MSGTLGCSAETANAKQGQHGAGRTKEFSGSGLADDLHRELGVKLQLLAEVLGHVADAGTVAVAVVVLAVCQAGTVRGIQGLPC